MCTASVCGICQHKSWSGCSDPKHIVQVMNTSSKSDWCSCLPFDDEEVLLIDGTTYPPRAGCGYRRASDSSINK
ncbi:hypothetical protein KGF54_004669 [Candida jiufengensis]|uniref:uncharacterized protein n=1 Tax=Candida jiufengensis TaxID=497108 RepID=UPI00222495EA|nr:uncharacterized protein KGF54_004669 [Candida jiufengensis]KAI5951595.1 hypothetical protein KGF54_004669 [Candida jiufengensis]